MLPSIRFSFPLIPILRQPFTLHLSGRRFQNHSANFAMNITRCKNPIMHPPVAAFFTSVSLEDVRISRVGNAGFLTLDLAASIIISPLGVPSVTI